MRRRRGGGGGGRSAGVNEGRGPFFLDEPSSALHHGRCNVTILLSEDAQEEPVSDGRASLWLRLPAGHLWTD